MRHFNNFLWLWPFICTCSSPIFIDNPSLQSVVVYIDAPFYDDPIPPNGSPGEAYFKVLTPFIRLSRMIFKGDLYLRILYSQVYFSSGSMKWLKPFFYPVSPKNILSLSSAHMVSILCYCWMVAETLSSIVCLSTTDHKSVSNYLNSNLSLICYLYYPIQIIWQDNLSFYILRSKNETVVWEGHCPLNVFSTASRPYECLRDSWSAKWADL